MHEENGPHSESRVYSGDIQQNAHHTNFNKETWIQEVIGHFVPKDSNRLSSPDKRIGNLQNDDWKQEGSLGVSESFHSVTDRAIVLVSSWVMSAGGPEGVLVGVIEDSEV